MPEFNPENPDDISRLNNAVEESVNGLSGYRANYNYLRKLLGDPCHQDRPRVENRQVVSKMDEFFTTLTRACVSRSPTLRIGRTAFPRNSGMLKTQIEAWSTRNHMDAALSGVFHETLLRWGVGYMSATTGPDSHAEPSLQILDFEDYICDLRQSDEEEMDFEGHEYEIFFEELKDSSQYDQDAVNAMGDGSQSEESFGRRQLYERRKVRCLWLKRHGLLLTLPCGEGNKALRIDKYKGPPEGPYLRMHLTRRRGALVPTSRASFLCDLHDFCAVTQRQVFLQADQFCEFFLVDSAFTQAAEIHRTAEYGQYYTVDNVNAVKREVKGGVNQQTMLASQQASDMFNERAGNLRLLAGISTGEPTARQSQQLGFGVDAMVRDCRKALNLFAKKVYDQVAWYIRNVDNGMPRQVEWTDATGYTAPSWWVPGVGQTMPPGDPQLEIIPESMIDRTAEEQAASLLQSIREISQLMAVPGNKPVFLNHQELVDQLKELRNQPQLTTIFGEAQDQESLVPGSETAAGISTQSQPASYSQPAASSNLKDRLMFQSMQPQPAEA